MFNNENPMGSWDWRYQTNGRPMIVAHRGGYDLGAENTLATFDKSISCGADAIETDVILTGDNIPVCSHDSEISVSGQLLSIPDVRLEFLRKIAPEIPTFSEIVSLDVPIYIDVKPSSQTLRERLIRSLNIEGIQRRFAIGVKNREESALVTETWPSLWQIYLGRDPAAAVAFAQERPNDWVRVHEPDAQPDFMSRLKDCNVRVIITCGSRDGREVGEVDQRNLEVIFGLEPDAIIVNNPASARNALFRT